MKRRSSIPLLLLTSVAAVGVPMGIASATPPTSIIAIGVPPPPSPTPTTILLSPACSSPSAATCLDPTVYGTFSPGSCAWATQNACATRLQSGYQSHYRGWGAPRTNLAWDGVTLLPADDLGGSGYKARFLRSNNISVQSNTSATYDGSQLASIIGRTAPPSNTSVLAIPPSLAYAIDGLPIGSCNEYAYKRFWDYERYRDDAMGCKGDPHCAFDATYGLNGHTAPLAIVSSSSVIAKKLMERNGTSPLDSQIDLRTGLIGKNPFFDIPLTAISSPDPSLTATEKGALATVAAYISAKEANSAYYALGVSGGAEHFDNELAFYKAMHDRSTATTDAQFDDQDVRIATFQQVAATYLATVGALSGVTNGGGWQGFDPGRVMISDSVNWGQQFAGAATSLVGKGVLSVSAFPGMPASIAPAGGMTVQSFGPTVSIQSALLALQHAVAAEAARPDSCYTPTNYACDWQPHAFARHFASLYGSDVEAAYDDCLEIAGATFNVTAAVANDPNPTGDVPNLKTWIDSERALLYEALKHAPHYPGGTKSAIGISKTDGTGFGDPSIASASLSYEFDWNVQEAAVKGSTTTACAIRGGAGAHVSATASILGSFQNLVASDTSLVVNPIGNTMMLTSSTTILGNDIAYPDIVQSGDRNSPATWHAPIASRSYPLISDGATFFVLGIPVTVSGGLDAGFQISLDATAHANDACSQTTPAPTFGADLTLDPKAYLDLSLSGAIGVPGFEGGVKGILSLLTIDANQSLGANVVPDSQSSTGLALQFTGDGTMNFNELSGEVDLFEEFLFWEADQKLFSWDGLNQSIPLWHLPTLIVPLEVYQLVAPPAGIVREG